jgi:hypothetical protein
MSIRFEHSIDVSCNPEQTFALLDDLSQTPQWLARCVGIEKLKTGQNVVGDKLRYSYKDSSGQGVMDGEITARIPNENLSFHYWDKMMDVTIEFHITRSSNRTQLTHVIDITPKTFMAKLLSPLIRKQLPKQTITAMDSLSKLLESATRHE